MSYPAKDNKAEIDQLPGPRPVEAPPRDDGRDDVEVRPPRRKPSANDLRRQRTRRLILRALIVVGLPTIIATVYYTSIVTPRYESVAAFTVQSADGRGAAGLEFLLAAVPGTTATRDSLLVQAHIHSRDMFRRLIEEQGFIEHYSSPDVDYFSRLDASAGFEEQYDYYKDHVKAEYDSGAGIVKLRVQAFSAEKAQEIAQFIIQTSQDMVNQMMQDARRDRIELASREVDSAEQRVTAARQQILELQQEHSDLNPAASAEAILTVRSNLESQLAQAEAELNTLSANLQPDAPQLVAQRQKVSALRRQVAQQNRRLTGSDAEGLSGDIAAFEPLMAEKEFAQRALTAALKSLELARLEADRQHRYLVTISEPSAPDQPTHPRPFIAIITVFVLSLAALVIGSLFVASLREHANL